MGKAIVTLSALATAAGFHLHVLQEMERVLERSTPPLQDLEHALAPLVTFVVLPVFALANAGVTGWLLLRFAWKKSRGGLAE